MAVALFQGCNCGGPTCTRTGGGDAGTQLRARGEPCTDGIACAPGLSCQNTSLTSPNNVQMECLSPADGAGACAPGLVNFGGACHTACMLDSDCTGRLAMQCFLLRAGPVRGYCGSLSCSQSQACPSAATCVAPVTCCPPGAPCAMPPDGFCLR